MRARARAATSGSNGLPSNGDTVSAPDRKTRRPVGPAPADPARPPETFRPDDAHADAREDAQEDAGREHAGHGDLAPVRRRSRAGLAGTVRALAVAGLSFLAFLGGATVFLALVPAESRLAAAGVLLIVAGVAIALANAARAETEARARVAADLDARASEIAFLRADREILQDEIWHLRESDERHRDVLDTLGDVVMRWREGGEIIYANDAARALFPGVGLAALHDAPQKAQTVARDDLLLETARGWRWFSRRDIAVRDLHSGEPLIQTILRDVTDRREIEDALVAARNQAETASAAKSRFLATVSHEIRTPLNGILGMAGLLADTRLTAEQRSYVEAVKSSGEILLLLISEVLDLSRIEAGRLDLAPSATDIARLSEGVAELLSPRAFAKGLEIGCLVAPDLPRRIVVDANRLRQILYNLAGNGLKFTETGGVEIRVYRAGPQRLRIAVRDTGIGFAPEEAERLFEEFEQVDHGPARRFDGAGLGLAISRRLARLMGGEITAVAAPGAGARFEVDLPLQAAPEDEADDGDRPPDRYLAGKTIVVLGEGRIEAPLLAEDLRGRGAEVALIAAAAREETDDRDALLARADLLVVDPGALKDAGAWLAGARAAGVGAPAVALVAPTDRASLPRLRAAGFGAYLIRPVRSTTLHRVLAGLLGGLGPQQGWEIATRDTALPADRPAAVPSRVLKVLVADDNDINRLLSEAMVRKLGHAAFVAADGGEALELAADGSFDLILMDLHMPGLDGVSAIRRFRALEQAQGWERIPVFAVTADVTAEAADAARAAGADGVITKPIDPDLMRQHLAAAGV